MGPQVGRVDQAVDPTGQRKRCKEIEQKLPKAMATSDSEVAIAFGSLCWRQRSDSEVTAPLVRVVGAPAATRTVARMQLGQHPETNISVA